MNISPEKVHETLKRYMLVDGFDFVFDSKKSKGCQIYDSKHDRYLLDCFSFFASAPIGTNHPKLNTPEFIKKIGEVAVNNPTNSDCYTTEMAEFVDTFSREAVPNYFKHLFFISGGSLAVENAVKTSFDWKIRKNFEKGKKEELGTQVIHFKEAFHGRTGYTICMTNTFNKNKTKYFTKFSWPRITNPKITFPLNPENLSEVEKLEEKAVAEIKKAVEENPDDIAALIIEPIQGEGGDNHFRKEFFQSLRRLCDEHEIMFILDEVQSGVGLTGKMWAYEHFGFKPDIIAFGKKTQVCGIMVNSRVDEVKDNVFNVSSRLNSTWGGNLVDMVRCQKYLEVIKEENLVKNAEIQGKRLLTGLKDASEKYPNVVHNARGRGLMCAFDMSDTGKRDQLIKKLYVEGIVVIGCGEKTIRYRPPLIISEEEIDISLGALNDVLKNF
jgi:L-lysine 6-transaminase